MRAIRDDPDFDDDYRFQNHLRGYQDLFSKDFDFSPAGEGKLAEAAKLLGLTLGTLPAYAFTNLLFDWEDVTLSPTARQYFLGIDRTYGLRPYHCYDLPIHGSALCAGERGRPSPNSETARGHTMSALANLYYHQAEIRRGREAAGKPPIGKIPFWVVNTTAAVTKNLTDWTRGNLEDTVFEFTPYGFGSRHYGRWIGSPENLPLPKAVGASGAFLDSQQRQWNEWVNWLVGRGLTLLNLNWGISIRNPRLRDESRVLHNALPFPFYYFHRNFSTRSAGWIHLSDGGQSENTGVWSLVRRGVSTIILADNAEDSDGRFTDLCLLRADLEKRRLHLAVPELDRFEAVCANEARYPPNEWKHRAVWGCISSEHRPNCRPDRRRTVLRRSHHPEARARSSADRALPAPLRFAAPGRRAGPNVFERARGPAPQRSGL